MAQYRMNAYDADVFIPEFKGLMQYGDPMGDDLRYSPDCLNVETPGGVLQPAVENPEIKVYRDRDFLDRLPTHANVTIMAARITNCFETAYTGSTIGYWDGNEYKKVQTTIQSGAEYDLFILSVALAAYEIVLPVCSKENVSPRISKDEHGMYTVNGKPIDSVSAQSVLSFGYGDNWSWCTYEHDYGEGGEGEPSGRTNVLVMASEKNGTYVYSKPGVIQELSVLLPPFKYISRYAERLWAVGVGEDHDTIYYSRAYDISNWSPAGSGEQAEDGGGEIRLATFDEDRISALVPFGDSLIVFSQYRAWRITGTDPSSFYIQEQYGNGTKYPKTIAVMDNRIIMLTNSGLVSYDGTTVLPFMQQYTHDLFYERLDYKEDTPPTHAVVTWGNTPPVAVVHGRKYILSLSNKIIQWINALIPTGGMNAEGYSTIIYDSVDGTINIVSDTLVKDMCTFGGGAFTANTNVSYISIRQIATDSFAMKNIVSSATRWVSPWIDLGRKDVQKGGFELYFYPELNTNNAQDSVALKFSIQTEKKTKTKTYTVQALTAAQVEAGRGYRQKRLHFGGAGRRFRLIIETAPGNTVPWRLIGGIHIIAETDRD